MVGNEWVVLELTPQGEDEDPDVLRASLTRTLKGCEIFIPASISKVGGSRVVHKLIDNYVFVKREQPDPFYFKVEGSKYVLTVLTAPVGRTRRISTVKDADIAKMKRQIVVETEQGIEVDDEVEVTSGAYKGIRCRVIEEIKENDSVQVYVSLRSKQTIVTLPRSFLKYVPAEDQSDVPSFAPFLTRMSRTQDLVRRAKELLVATEGFNPFALLAQKVRASDQYKWVSKLLPLIKDVTGRRHLDEVRYIPDGSALVEASRKVALLRKVADQGQEINDQLTKIEDTLRKAEKNAQSKRNS
jgi:transcription antitermination factor NusG